MSSRKFRILIFIVPLVETMYVQKDLHRIFFLNIVIYDQKMALYYKYKYNVNHCP